MILTKPIKAHGETVTEIKLTEPSGALIRLVKQLPYWMGDGETVAINAPVANKYISQLAQIPPSSVDQICAADLNKLYWQLIGLFTSGDASEAQMVKLRDVLGSDIRMVRAVPYWLQDGEMVAVNAEAVCKYIERLADFEPALVDEMSAPVFNALAWKIVGFFMSGESQTQSSSSASSSTALNSGE